MATNQAALKRQGAALLQAEVDAFKSGRPTGPLAAGQSIQSLEKQIASLKKEAQVFDAISRDARTSVRELRQEIFELENPIDVSLITKAFAEIARHAERVKTAMEFLRRQGVRLREERLDDIFNRRRGAGGGLPPIINRTIDKPEVQKTGISTGEVFAISFTSGFIAEMFRQKGNIAAALASAFNQAIQLALQSAIASGIRGLFQGTQGGGSLIGGLFGVVKGALGGGPAGAVLGWAGVLASTAGAGVFGDFSGFPAARNSVESARDNAWQAHLTASLRAAQDNGFRL